MKAFSFSHLDNGVLRRDLASANGQDCAATATLLALIAEFDARRLYLQDGYESMFAYTVHELHRSEQGAFKRIRAARTAREFPAIFQAVADGRLHLSAVILLTPYLTADNAAELLAAAEHKTKAEIERLLAERFPRPDLPTRVEHLSAPPSLELSPGTVEPNIPGRVQESQPQLSPGTVELPVPRPKMTPLSAQRVALQVTVDVDDYECLRYAQALLGHQVPAGELGKVMGLAFRSFAHELEKRKFAATSRPRSSQRSSADARHIPPHVKRAVWERDGGQCSFVGDNGRRCGSQKGLEYDHVDPVARGGEATVDGIRLRCRAHNQYEAECVFGAGFMSQKREAAMAARARKQAAAAEARAAAAEEREQAAAVDPDVILALRRLQYRADEARAAAAHCTSLLPPDAPLEQKVRIALGYFRPKGVTIRPTAA